LLLTIDYSREHSRVLQEARETARQEISLAASGINEHLNRLAPGVEKVAESMSKGKPDDSALRRQMRRLFDKQAELLEVGAAFVPQLRDNKPYAPHYGIKQDKKRFFQVEESYDYTRADWYKSTIDIGAHWIEPYFGGATRTLVTGYCVPCYQDNAGGDRVIAGVFRANISLAKANRLLQEQQLGKTGYGFLLSKNGIIIAHPKADYVTGSTTLPDLAREEKDNSLISLQRKLKESQTGVINRINTSTGQTIWTFYERIPSTGWTLVANMVPDEVLQDYTIHSRSRRAVVLTGWVLLGLLVTIFTGLLVHHRCAKPYRWGISTVCSLILILGIALLWGNIGNNYRFQNQTVLVDRAGIAHVLAEVDRMAEKHNAPHPFRIPTGLFIQSLEFTNANNVTVTGYLWQKYNLKKHRGIEQGFIFPESFSGSVSETYRKRTGDIELVGWYFEAMLRQPFDYKFYPFDHKNVWLRIWHKDFEKSVALIPDLDAYPVINPAERPGVESAQDFVLNGWSLKNSYFEYKTHVYNNTFGMEDKTGRPNVPELYFIIELERNFIDAFITNLVPLMVVMFMLLATLITVSRSPDKGEKFGANPFAILGACSALFFIVLLSHIQLRQQLAVSDIMYMEYFYFVMYIAILWVSISAFLIVSHMPLPFIHYRDGILIKALFLPLILLFLFIITFLVFF
jgi:hypothetical protein